MNSIESRRNGGCRHHFPTVSIIYQGSTVKSEFIPQTCPEKKKKNQLKLEFSVNFGTKLEEHVRHPSFSSSGQRSQIRLTSKSVSLRELDRYPAVLFPRRFYGDLLSCLPFIRRATKGKKGDCFFNGDSCNTERTFPQPRSISVYIMEIKCPVCKWLC